MSEPEVTYRDARDDDAEALIALIGGCFAEYPGCVMDVDGELPELRAIATYFREHDGRFWVAEAELPPGTPRRVVACGGFTSASRPGGVELRKLYVEGGARRLGIARTLCDRIEAAARARGATFVDLWSDTRFTKAHALYEKRGYVRSPTTRELHDKSDTVEHHFEKTLA